MPIQVNTRTHVPRLIPAMFFVDRHNSWHPVTPFIPLLERLRMQAMRLFLLRFLLTSLQQGPPEIEGPPRPRYRGPIGPLGPTRRPMRRPVRQLPIPPRWHSSPLSPRSRMPVSPAKPDMPEKKALSPEEARKKALDAIKHGQQAAAEKKAMHQAPPKKEGSLGLKRRNPSSSRGSSGSSDTKGANDSNGSTDAGSATKRRD